MIFGGVQKNSFIDYPGKVSCVLFLSGCNFDCPYCHNPRLAGRHKSTAGLFDEKYIIDFLEKRKIFLDGVVISGGEPTIQNGLIDLCRRIKQIGYPVKLDTNGSRPQVLQQLIEEGLVDYVAMDIKTDPFKYDQVSSHYGTPENIISSIRRIMTSGLPYEFRTTCIKPLINPQLIENIVEFISGAQLYALQKFHHSEILNPEFFQNAGRACTEKELEIYKDIANPWVEKCVIRL